MKRIDDWTVVLTTFFIAFAGMLLFCLTAFGQTGKQIRFTFLDGRSALARAQNCQAAVQLISDARQRGIWPTLYGVPLFYYQGFYVDLRDWTPAEQTCIANGLNVLRVP